MERFVSSLMLSSALCLQPQSAFRSVDIHVCAAVGPADLYFFFYCYRKEVHLSLPVAARSHRTVTSVLGEHTTL